MPTPDRRSLPLFKSPPVVETVLGVQFLALEQFAIPHFGLLWSQIRDRYPKTQVKPALGPVVEQFEGIARESLGLEIPVVPNVRCWFIDEAENHLIQVQKDRFHLNWKKVTGKEEYPQYHSLKPRFEAEWQLFCSFIKEQGLGTVEVTQCELTYVNHIERGKGWSKYSSIPDVIRLASQSTDFTLLREPEQFSLETSYMLPDKKGRLHVSVKPGLRRDDGKEILIVTLTARGKPQSMEIDAMGGWLDLGHEWIVNGFTDITTPKMHSIWERTL